MRAIVAGLGAAWLALAAGTAAAADEASASPVVVELFTSQGCSSCPPADKLMHRLAERGDVIPLSLHVDYWDYIGWADSFARPEHTLRQKAYAQAVGERMVYTPKMIVGGAVHVAGANAMDVMDAIQAKMATATPVTLTVSRAGDMVSIVAQRMPDAKGPLIVQLVRYRPMSEVEILRGENSGKTLTYVNVVTDWDIVGEWDDAPDWRRSVPVVGTEPAVVIVQRDGHGAILAAAKAQ